MAIKAITQAIPHNTITHFTGNVGNKPEKSQTSHTAPVYKAVPLAVLIALSPLTTSAADNTRTEKETNNIEEVVSTAQVNNTQQTVKVISSKTFSPQPDLYPMDDSDDVIVRVVEKNGKKMIDFGYMQGGGEIGEWTKTLEFSDKVKIVKNNLAILSADGTTKNTSVTNLQVMALNNYAILYYNKDLINYVRELGEKYPGTLQTETNNSNVTCTGFPIPRIHSVRWKVEDRIQNAKAPTTSLGVKQKSFECQTENGKFFISGYSDPGSNKLKTFTIQKEGYPELQVKNIYFWRVTLKPDPTQSIQFGRIDLQDADNREYYILNNSLTNVLSNLKHEYSKPENPIFDNAYNVYKCDKRFKFYPDGRMIQSAE